MQLKLEANIVQIVAAACRRSLACGVLAAGVLVAPSAALAAERIALIIGNGDYKSLSELDNPNSDARLIARKLDDLNFDVTLLQDSTQVEMKRAILNFGRDLRQGGRDAVGLFFYAGHGIQSQGKNFLIPVEASPADEADLDLMGVEANWVMRQMESAGNATNIMILDACRDNPLASNSRSATRGLARIQAPTGTFIAYATAPGQTAVDGAGDNSPFSLALANALPTPGLPVEQIFKQVRVEVLKATNGSQTPWDSSSLVQDFYFNEAPPEPAPSAPKANPLELSLWQSVRQSGDPARIALFLQIYPDSEFADEAQALMTKSLADNPGALLAKNDPSLQGGSRAAAPAARPPAPTRAAPVVPKASEHEMIAAAQASGSAEDYRAYLAAYPNGVFADLARAEVAHREAQEAPQAPVSAFDRPLTAGALTRGKSLRELARSSPEFPPVEGLPADFWKDKACSNCHNWSIENLCKQGEFYAGKDPSTFKRIQHPFGGPFKEALAAWAAAGCEAEEDVAKR